MKKHIPSTVYLQFDSCDASKILVKLKEFNGQLPDESAKVSDGELEMAIKLISQKDPNDEAIEGFKKIMNWPNEKLFPVLDVMRLSVRNAEFCTKVGTSELLEFIVLRILTNAANQLMSIRALCNLMTHKIGRDLIDKKLNDIMTLIGSIQQGTPNLQNAIATFYLSQSIAQKELPSDDLCRMICIEIVQFLEWTSDPEATYRAYLALGNLVAFNSQESTQILKAAKVVKDGLKSNKNSPHQKLAEISSELSDKLML